jgi:isocitrate dehydrogenase kinase/phosphatase
MSDPAPWLAAHPSPVAAGREASSAAHGAEAIRTGFDAHQRQFWEITCRAASRQERRNWHGMQHDAVERLDLYEQQVSRTLHAVRAALGEQLHRKECWARMKALYADLVSDRVDAELAETFFNSITRRVFTIVGVDPWIGFDGTDFERLGTGTEPRSYSTYAREGSTENLIQAILSDRVLPIPYQDLDRDARLIAADVEIQRRAGLATAPIEAIDVLDPVFYRNKGAYLIGRIRGQGQRITPLVIALVHEEGRLVADAVLLTEDEASIVFSFTRSSFHVDVEGPRGVIRFLKSIIPAKRLAELYIALGYHKHGKAELYRDLTKHLERSFDRFEIAPGDRGMVMVVFTLPSYDIVFKVIRDVFDYPKTTTRRDVLERYQLVFKHDRAGRLVDAQEFEHLAFPKHRFSEALLKELQESAAASIVVDDEHVVLRHVYTERRVTPLNLYLWQGDERRVRDAVLDYGQAIRDLAATNIFPGDLLLKNFGVTRHGRVIFYDYDELCLLTDCNFREMPVARDLEEEMAAEPWYYVGPHDVFPEEFATFLGLSAGMREAFVAAHGELLTAEFWTRMQALHRSGEVVDIFPYRAARRLQRADHAR